MGNGHVQVFLSGPESPATYSYVKVKILLDI